MPRKAVSCDLETSGSMMLISIIENLRHSVQWPGYDHAWFKRELGAVGMIVDATGGRIHAVVVGLHGFDDTTYADFSPCAAPCGSHGLPTDPEGEQRPCMTFLVKTSTGGSYYRDESSDLVEIGEA